MNNPDVLPFGVTMVSRTAPSVICILLHLYYCPEAIPSERFPSGSEAQLKAIDELMNAGMVQKATHCTYTVTPKGVAWVEMICHTPHPEERPAFFNPVTNQLISRQASFKS